MERYFLNLVAVVLSDHISTNHEMYQPVNAGII